MYRLTSDIRTHDMVTTAQYSTAAAANSYSIGSFRDTKNSSSIASIRYSIACRLATELDLLASSIDIRRRVHS
jgi:hypothetical protein